MVTPVAVQVVVVKVVAVVVVAVVVVVVVVLVLVLVVVPREVHLPLLPARESLPPNPPDLPPTDKPVVGRKFASDGKVEKTLTSPIDITILSIFPTEN